MSTNRESTTEKPTDVKNKKADWADWCADNIASDLQPLFERIGNSTVVQSKVDSLVAGFYKPEIDMIAVHAEMISTISGYLRQLDEVRGAEHHALRTEQEEEIKRHIKEFSSYIVQKNLNENVERSNDPSIAIDEDHTLTLSAQARRDLQKEVRRFLIYEIYKVMNPIQIAGETMRQNFIKNAKVRGVDDALKYEGGERSAMRKYGKQTVKEVERDLHKRKDQSFDFGFFERKQ